MDVLQHFMSDEDDITRIQVCTTIAGCFNIIRCAENELYPMVHLFWPPLLLRLRDRNPRVRIAALDCVCAIIATSTWFAKSRVVEDLLPILQKDLGLGQRSLSGVLAIASASTEDHPTLSIESSMKAILIAKITQGRSKPEDSIQKSQCDNNHTCGAQNQLNATETFRSTARAESVCDACVSTVEETRGKPLLHPTLQFLTKPNGRSTRTHASGMGSSIYSDLWRKLLQCVVCVAEHIPLEDVAGSSSPPSREYSETLQSSVDSHEASEATEDLNPSQTKRGTTNSEPQGHHYATESSVPDNLSVSESVEEGPMAELGGLIDNMLVEDPQVDVRSGKDDDTLRETTARHAAHVSNKREMEIVEILCSMLWPCMHELAPDMASIPAREGYSHLLRKTPLSVNKFQN